MPNKQGRIDGAIKEGLTKNTNIPNMYTIFSYFENISKCPEARRNQKKKRNKKTLTFQISVTTTYFSKSTGQTLVAAPDFAKFAKIVQNDDSNQRRWSSENYKTQVCSHQLSGKQTFF